MPRNKSITSIDNRIKKVQEDLFKTKARLDKLVFRQVKTNHF